MVLVFLFLPAADDRGSSGPGHHNNFARYWSFSAHSSASESAYMLFFTAGTAQRPGAFGRQMGFSIRLASRSELFGCSVDGVGLLFLPALDYWGATGDATRVEVARAVRMSGLRGAIVMVSGVLIDYPFV